ncbi:peptidyl-prolyl cis-trans isomerase FKBP17-1, chloroplastic isoform X4 [Punica granatum]|uniref:peptidylprolyl isomerase n=1 Tax=Punica granatum TaxID=22663 RepID=A0A6P8D601_PUNGR|nr:peptidyl-prolyl cis-trans isomerase FKBP17-1, chloroplastic isoform X4 [Punica granatum]
MTTIQCCGSPAATAATLLHSHFRHLRHKLSLLTNKPTSPPSPDPAITLTRRDISLSAIVPTSSFFFLPASPAKSVPAEFFELPGSGGVKALDLRVGSGDVSATGDQVAIHYFGRLAAKQGWRFDSTYDHKDDTGEPIPFVFTLGSGKFFDRQRLFTTIFNPTRLANGEGSTLGTLIFDIELVSLRHREVP